MTLILNGTTGVSAVDGTAATPAIQGNDTNTGMFFPAADTVAIATNGVERLRVNSSGTTDINLLTVQTNAISAVNSLGFRNRIINGDMRIDQRNNGASAVMANGVYYLDRFQTTNLTQPLKATVQRSTTAPGGFTNSLLITSTSAYSITQFDTYCVSQAIEGLNTSDLEWGTASAKTVTLSFWVRSSITGTWSGAIQNSDYSRCYPFTYTISVADTWEQKSVTIPGDTTGTWLTNTSAGVRVCFSVGSGSSYSGTAGAWGAALYNAANSTNSLLGINGATWYITGLQFEAGSVATPFERRDYGRELMMCQRYYQAFTKPVLRGLAGSASSLNRLGMPTLVTMRAAPTVVLSGTVDWYDGSTAGTLTTQSASYSTTSSIEIDGAPATGTTVQNRPIVIYIGSNTGTITASAEL